MQAGKQSLPDMPAHESDTNNSTRTCLFSPPLTRSAINAYTRTPCIARQSLCGLELRNINVRQQLSQ